MHWNFCPNCGTKLESEWKHCPQCGLAREADARSELTDALIKALRSAPPYVGPIYWPYQPPIIMPPMYGTITPSITPPYTVTCSSDIAAGVFTSS